MLKTKHETRIDGILDRVEKAKAEAAPGVGGQEEQDGWAAMCMRLAANTLPSEDNEQIIKDGGQRK